MVETSLRWSPRPAYAKTPIGVPTKIKNQPTTSSRSPPTATSVTLRSSPLVTLVGEDGGAQLLRQSKKGLFEPAIEVDPYNDGDIAAADMDGDSMPDLVIVTVDSEYSDCRVLVLRNTTELGL